MRLIDADALIKELKHITDAYGGDDGDAVFTFYDPLVRRNQLVNMEEFIKRCQTIEPMPSRDWNGWEDGKGTTLPTPPVKVRKRGRWMVENWMLMCSECGDVWGMGQEKEVRSFNYCPCCGAQMENQA